MSEHRTPPGPPPTVANLKAMGLTGVNVTCIKCRRSKGVIWDALKAKDETLFPEIATQHRFRCFGCGAREASVMPDWTCYRPQGGG